MIITIPTPQACDGLAIVLTAKNMIVRGGKEFPRLGGGALKMQSFSSRRTGKLSPFVGRKARRQTARSGEPRFESLSFEPRGRR